MILSESENIAIEPNVALSDDSDFLFQVNSWIWMEEIAWSLSAVVGGVISPGGSFDIV